MVDFCMAFLDLARHSVRRQDHSVLCAFKISRRRSILLRFATLRSQLVHIVLNMYEDNQDKDKYL